MYQTGLNPFHSCLQWRWVFLLVLRLCTPAGEGAINLNSLKAQRRRCRFTCRNCRKRLALGAAQTSVTNDTFKGAAKAQNSVSVLHYVTVSLLVSLWGSMCGKRLFQMAFGRSALNVATSSWRMRFSVWLHRAERM